MSVCVGVCVGVCVCAPCSSTFTRISLALITQPIKLFKKENYNLKLISHYCLSLLVYIFIIYIHLRYINLFINL